MRTRIRSLAQPGSCAQQLMPVSESRVTVEPEIEAWVEVEFLLPRANISSYPARVAPQASYEVALASKKPSHRAPDQTCLLRCAGTWRNYWVP